jgi:hypothetical protein
MILRISPVPLSARTAALIESTVSPGAVVSVYPDTDQVQAALAANDWQVVVLESAPPGVREAIVELCAAKPVFRPEYAERSDNHGHKTAVVATFHQA